MQFEAAQRLEYMQEVHTICVTSAMSDATPAAVYDIATPTTITVPSEDWKMTDAVEEDDSREKKVQLVAQTTEVCIGLFDKSDSSPKHGIFLVRPFSGLSVFNTFMNIPF